MPASEAEAAAAAAVTAVLAAAKMKRRRDSSVASAAKLSPKQRILKRVRMVCSSVISTVAAADALCADDDALACQLKAFGLMKSLAQASLDSLKPSDDEIKLTLVRHGFVPGDKSLRAAHPTGLGVMYDTTINVVGRTVVCNFPGALSPIKDPLVVLKAVLQNAGELAEALDVDADVAKACKARTPRTMPLPPGARMQIPAVVLRVCGMDYVRLANDDVPGDARIDVVVGTARDIKAPQVVDVFVRSTATNNTKAPTCRVHVGVLLRLLHASAPDLIAAAKELAAKKVTVMNAEAEEADDGGNESPATHSGGGGDADA